MRKVITIKTDEEIELMRQSGQRLGGSHKVEIEVVIDAVLLRVGRRHVEGHLQRIHVVRQAVVHIRVGVCIAAIAHSQRKLALLPGVLEGAVKAAVEPQNPKRILLSQIVQSGERPLEIGVQANV